MTESIIAKILSGIPPLTRKGTVSALTADAVALALAWREGPLAAVKAALISRRPIPAWRYVSMS
jgi:hypothetical protein